MELWLHSEIRTRRDDASKTPAAVGSHAWLPADEVRAIRARIAAGAEAMSNALAALARSLRNGETA